MAYTPEFRQQISQAQDQFVWETPSWESFSRGSMWYVWMAVIALLFISYAVYTNNFLFAFIILISVIIMVLAGHQEPSAILVQIGPHGVVYNGRLYLFDEISDFAIIYQPPDTKILYIQPKSVLRPRLRIHLVNEDPVAIRRHLKQFLAEDLDLRDEHFSDMVGRLLRM